MYRLSIWGIFPMMGLPSMEKGIRPAHARLMERLLRKRKNLRSMPEVHFGPGRVHRLVIPRHLPVAAEDYLAVPGLPPVQVSSYSTGSYVSKFRWRDSVVARVVSPVQGRFSRRQRMKHPRRQRFRGPHLAPDWNDGYAQPQHLSHQPTPSSSRQYQLLGGVRFSSTAGDPKTSVGQTVNRRDFPSGQDLCAKMPGSGGKGAGGLLRVRLGPATGSALRP